MRLLLCVHGSDENCPSSSLVLLTITPEYARQMLQRREIVRQIDGRSEELGRLWALSFWDATPRWLGHDQEVEASPEFASVLATGKECEDMEGFLRTRLGDHLVEQVLSDPKIVELSNDFTLDDRLADGTECDQVLLDMLGARYRTYLRHVDGGQETDIVPWAYFERAAQEACFPQHPSLTPDGRIGMPSTTPTLMIHLNDGIVHQIVSSVPFPVGWNICVIDQDDEAKDPYRASTVEVQCAPQEVARLFDEAEASERCADQD